MRKYKYIIFLLGLVLAGSLLGSFYTASASEKEEKDATETVATYAQINAFDSWQDIYEVEYTTFFGRATLNTKKEYITQGDASAKLQVYGDFLIHGSTTPQMQILLSDEPGTDLSRLKSISFDIFNESGKETQIGVALQINDMKTVVEYYDLAEGKNHITASYNVKGMAGSYDLTNGQYLLIEFPRAMSNKEGKKNVFYLDNVSMDMSLIAPKPYTMTFDEGELCSFDKVYQEFVTVVGGVSTYTDLPIVEVNKDPAYCMNLEGRSLKVTLPSAVAETSGAVLFKFIPAIWEQYDWTQLGKEDKELVFDVYNDSDVDVDFNFSVWPNQSGTAYLAYRWSQGIHAKSREWVTVRIPIAEWNRLSREGGKKGDMVYEPIKREVDWMMSKGNYQVPFVVFNKFKGEDRVLYFDNFRIEDRAAQ